MEKKILEEIKEAEKKSKRIVENSHIKKELIIQKGKEKAKEMIKEQETKSEQEKEKEVSSKMKQLEETKQEIIRNGDKEVKKIGSTAEKNISKAVDYVLKKFNEKVR
ncbi:hypothetical protein HQ529_03035 [Candidatus Woesearchaeota archaeon]|nr:hypothetical protein [Candidatus Woesearchaeota archaeon]